MPRLRDRIRGRLRRLARRRVVVDWSNRYSRENLYAFVDREIERSNARPGGERVLNVGAGGEIGRRLQAGLRGAHLIQVDLDVRRRPDVVADVSDLRCFPDESLDRVFLLEVLEHVKQPDAALAEIHRVLAKDAVLALSTPFFFEIHDEPDDFYRFTEQGLRHLLRRFRDVEIRRRNGYLKALLVPVMRLSRSRHLGDVVVGLTAIGLCRLLRPLIDRADRCIRSEAATSGYVALCRK